MAIMAVIPIDGAAAIRARVAFPVLQLDVGTAAAVVVENLGNQDEEVKEPAFGQAAAIATRPSPSQRRSSWT